jgi:predicted dinucleotide-binding enzyme
MQFAAGDEEETKATVLSLAKEMGSNQIDAGPLRHARLLEPLAALNSHLGRALGLVTEAGVVFILIDNQTAVALEARIKSERGVR